MLSIRPIIHKRIKQHNIVAVFTNGSFLKFVIVIFVIVEQRFNPLRIFSIFSNDIEYFNFIISSFEIMLCTFLDFQSYVCIEFEISSKPNCGEMAPSKFLNHHIPFNHNLSSMNRMIPTDLIVLYAFIFTLIAICKSM